MSGWDARRTYLYLTSLVTLIIAIFGAVGLTKDLVAVAYPEPSYMNRPDPYMITRAPGDTLYTRTELDSMAAEMKRTEDARQRYHRMMSLAGNIAMLVVSVPIFLWHIRQAQKAEAR